MGKKSREKKERRQKRNQQSDSLPAPDVQTLNEKIIKTIDIDDQDERILSILAVQNEDDAHVNYENLEKFLEYLRKSIEMPCIVTGQSDYGCFGWEEYYNFGPGNKKKYEKLKKKNPSFRDEYLLLKFEDDFNKEEGIFVQVQRISDKKLFTLTLCDLEAVDKQTKNAQLIDDFSSWHCNYRVD